MEDDQQAVELDGSAGDALRHIRNRLQVPFPGDILVAGVALKLRERVGLHLRERRSGDLVLHLEVLEPDLRGVADLGIARELGLQGDVDEAVAALALVRHEIGPVRDVKERGERRLHDLLALDRVTDRPVARHDLTGSLQRLVPVALAGKSIQALRDVEDARINPAHILIGLRHEVVHKLSDREVWNFECDLAHRRAPDRE